MSRAKSVPSGRKTNIIGASVRSHGHSTRCRTASSNAGKAAGGKADVGHTCDPVCICQQFKIQPGGRKWQRQPGHLTKHAKQHINALAKSHTDEADKNTGQRCVDLAVCGFELGFSFRGRNQNNLKATWRYNIRHTTRHNSPHEDMAAGCMAGRSILPAYAETMESRGLGNPVKRKFSSRI